MSDAVDLTWVGHATVLLDVGGFRIITDPVLTRRVAHLRRRRPVPSDSVADVDLVLISHAHMDHLHLPSLRRIRPGASVVTTFGAGSLLRRQGFTDVVEARVGDRVERGPVTIEVVPAAHPSGRGPHSGVAADPVGFVVHAPSGRVYFAGDTDLFDAMGDLGGVDLALLPIWGWGSSLGSGHLDPPRAAAATELIRPRIVVPMHWGTYSPEDARRSVPDWFHDPVPQFERALVEVDRRDRLQVIEPGDSLVLRGRADGPR